jgi:hypothetical protein
MKKPSLTIKTLDLSSIKKGEDVSEVLIGKSFSKRIWEGRFSKLCFDLQKNLSPKKK